MKPFIGQSVAAIRDHSNQLFRQGDEFMVVNRLPPHCKCGFELLAIGIKKRTTTGLQECATCKTVFTTPTDQIFFNADLFVPLCDIQDAMNEVMQVNLK